MLQYQSSWKDFVFVSSSPLRFLCCFLVLLPAVARAGDQPIGSPPHEIVFREGLSVKRVGRSGRTAFHIDPIEEMIVKGQWSPPKAGDTVKGSGGTDQAWEVAGTSGDGSFTNLASRGGRGGGGGGGGAYVYVPVKSESSEVMLLEPAGQDVVYVNGEPHAGDPYSNGIYQFPVQLRAGVNDFLFHVARGSLRAKLTRPKSPI